MSGTPLNSAGVEVRPISAEQHTDFLASYREASFLENPRWAQVKTEWDHHSMGIFLGGELVGASLVLGRRLPIPAKTPVLGAKRFVYLPKGPVVDTSRVQLPEVLPAVVEYLAATGAFLIRMGVPGAVRRWDAQEVRRALSAGEHQHISQLEPLEVDEDMLALADQLRQLGWKPPVETDDFEAGQPRFQARIPLEPAADPGDEDAVAAGVEAALARMDQTSRRQTRKSTRSELNISVGTEADLPAWQRLSEETAERDGFTTRPMDYFERIHRAMNASEISECKLLLAHYEDQLLAAALYVRQGAFGWYAYGASSSQERKRYAPRRLQLQQIEDSIRAGCHWYDLGGLTPALDPQHHLAGLTRFKTTMGADVVQTLGEWDFAVDRVLTAGFNAYMARR
ncbi:lipid II:glycine glycyltransferase FemX [Nesterenkonia alba]|uniref:lipid II:glycine glycyltransferase FemX n=1 Tax=Nesterenkonia alba TaxID=515814 RepID=UPI0003B35E3F|nr:peptidoglycan bridge formation glycyltransferase FemA/FemB family protein [Nesterenkonia alba]